MLNAMKSLAGKTIFQILFFFLLVTQICFAQWYLQNSGTPSKLNSVHFEDANNGFAVGDSGTILLSTNGGTDWSPILSGTTNALNDIYFTDANNGWAVGDSGTIIKTTNGGINWNQQTSGTVGQLNGIYFVDANNGWAVGEIWSDSSDAIILHTTNGGANWIPQVHVTYGFIGRPLGLRDVCFSDANTGTAVGGWAGDNNSRELLLRTTNGGTTWVKQLIGPDSAYGTPNLKGVTFTNTITGFAVGFTRGEMTTSGEIWHTIDGGSTWSLDSTTNLGLGYGYFLDVFFPDSDNGTVVGYCWESQEGVILHTIDAGANWIKQTSGTMNSLNGVFFTDALTGWIVGDNGTILHTTNGGVTAVNEEQIDDIPTEFLLSQNFPNPFNPSTKIKYSVPQSSKVVLKVFDVLGNEIETLVNEEKRIGSYEVNWNAADLPSGVYFYQLKAGEFISTKKMLLLK